MMKTEYRINTESCLATSREFCENESHNILIENECIHFSIYTFTLI